jgi:hypothetical protein
MSTILGSFVFARVTGIIGYLSTHSPDSLNQIIDLAKI